MKPSRHLIVSLSASGLFLFFTRSFYGAMVLFLSGVGSDLDHVIEYGIHYGWKDISVKKIYEASEKTGSKNKAGFKRLYLIFHVGEMALILWVLSLVSKNIYLLAISIGYTLHLLMDCIGNTLNPVAYFIIFRAFRNFDTSRLLRNGR